MEPVVPEVFPLDFDALAHPHVLTCCGVLFISGILCSAAGIGGGGVIVAALMTFGHLSPRDAVPVSKAVVFCGAVVSLVLNSRKTQGVSGQPLINWDIIRMMIPMALIGTLLGVLANVHLPESVIVVVLTTLLCGMTVSTTLKGWAQYQGELAAEEQEQAAAAGLDRAEEVVEYQTFPAQPKEDCKPFTNGDAVVLSSLLVLTIFGGVLRFHIHECVSAGHALSGARVFPNPSQCVHPVLTTFLGGHIGDWLAEAELAPHLGHLFGGVPLVLCAGLASFYYHRLAMSGHWTHQKLLAYQTVSCGTGLLAGLVGVGGGLIFSPFFLLMKVDPAVAVATSATCVVFTSTSTTFQYLLMDRVSIVVALIYGIVNCFSSWLGTTLVHQLGDRFENRKSYITFIVAASVAASAVLAVGKSFYNP